MTNLIVSGVCHPDLVLYTPVDAKVECQSGGPGGVEALIYPVNLAGVTFGMSHLSSCTDGQFKAGDRVALSGDTGVSTGPHLHWSQKQGGEFTHPVKGYLEIAVTGIVPQVTAGRGRSAQLVALQEAITGQESGGNCQAINPDSGAMGNSQIMPENLGYTSSNPSGQGAGWDATYLGRDIAYDEFMGSCALQQELTAAVLADYWSEAIAYTGGDEDEATRYVAAK